MSPSAPKSSKRKTSENSEHPEFAPSPKKQKSVKKHIIFGSEDEEEGEAPGVEVQQEGEEGQVPQDFSTDTYVPTRMPSPH